MSKTKIIPKDIERIVDRVFTVENIAEMNIHRDGKLFITGDPEVDKTEKIIIEGILKNVKLKKPLLFYLLPLTWPFYDLEITLANENNSEEITLYDFPFGFPLAKPFSPNRLKRRVKKHIGNKVRLDAEFNPNNGAFIINKYHF